MFEKYNIKASWFIPGHSLETFPEVNKTPDNAQLIIVGEHVD